MSLIHVDIPKRGKECTFCGASFLPGSPFYSLLKENEKEQLIRKDSCACCKEKEEIDEFTIHWKGSVPKKKPVFHNEEEKAFFYFKEAITSQVVEEKIEAFILALYLKKKKIFSLQGEKQTRNGGKVFLFEHKKTEESFLVPKFPLQEIDVLAVQQRISAKWQL